MTCYCVQLVETLAACATLYEHIGSSKLMPIALSDLTRRAWGRINQKDAWADIAGRKNDALAARLAQGIIHGATFH